VPNIIVVPGKNIELLLVLIQSKKLQSLSQICASQTWFWWFGFMFEPLSTTARAAKKNYSCFKSCQNWLKKLHYNGSDSESEF
jgi:hypothetical protein